jgi:ribosome-associated translation inhibitor RaiA
MDLTIVFRGFSPKPSAKNHIAEVSEHLERFFDNILSVSWDLELERFQVVAKCSVHSHSGYYRGTAKAPDHEQAVSLAAERVQAQKRRKHKLLVTKARGKKRRERPAASGE